MRGSDRSKGYCESERVREIVRASKVVGIEGGRSKSLRGRRSWNEW